MAQVAVQESHGHWFGIAYERNELVATAIGSTQEGALAAVIRCLPAGVRGEPAEPTEFVNEIAAMLGRLESGDETSRRFMLSEKHLPERLRDVLSAAAAIPLGYVTSYGNIARVAGSKARAVGRTMATNPLYPIVPCHRVVGSDFMLVGYGGRQDADALTAKLERLRSEVQGFTVAREIEVAANTSTVGRLVVCPVEWAVAAGRTGLPDSSQLLLFE